MKIVELYRMDNRTNDDEKYYDHVHTFYANSRTISIRSSSTSSFLKEKSKIILIPSIYQEYGIICMDLFDHQYLKLIKFFFLIKSLSKKKRNLNIQKILNL